MLGGMCRPSVLSTEMSQMYKMELPLGTLLLSPTLKTYLFQVLGKGAMTEGVNEHYMTEGMEVSDYPGDPIEQEQRRKTKEGYQPLQARGFISSKGGALFHSNREAH